MSEVPISPAATVAAHAAPVAPPMFGSRMASVAAFAFSLCAFALLLGWVLSVDPWSPPRWHTADKVLAVHILCMVLAVACVTWAICAWQLPLDHTSRKLIHFGLNFLGLVGLVVGLAATIMWDGHFDSGKHFYSFHSWIGILAFCMFVFNALGGIFTFLFPGGSPELRATVLPYHRAFGAWIYFLLIVAGVTGVMNREGMLVYTGMVALKGHFTYVANFFGLFVVLIASCVFFALTSKRTGPAATKVVV